MLHQHTRQPRERETNVMDTLLLVCKRAVASAAASVVSDAPVVELLTPVVKTEVVLTNILASGP